MVKISVRIYEGRGLRRPLWWYGDERYKRKYMDLECHFAIMPRIREKLYFLIRSADNDKTVMASPNAQIEDIEHLAHLSQEVENKFVPLRIHAWARPHDFELLRGLCDNVQHLRVA